MKILSHFFFFFFFFLNTNVDIFALWIFSHYNARRIEYSRNVNLGPREITNVLKFTKIYPCENI